MDTMKHRVNEKGSSPFQGGKKTRTDLVVLGLPNDLALIRVQSEDDVLLLFSRYLDHRCTDLKEIWDCNVRNGRILGNGIIILISDGG